MDYGDIIRLIIFGFIFLSFFGGLFGGKKKDEEQPKQQQPRPARPTDLSESGGPPQPRPRPVVIAEPAGPTTVFTEDSAPQYEVRRPELEPEQRPRETRPRDPRPRESLETDVRDTEQRMLERDITDMPTIGEDLDAERRPRRRRRQVRQPRQVEGGDVLRDSLRNPATLERAFIVKEVLDRPLGLRNDW